MPKINREDIYDRARVRFGDKAQIGVAAEECAEASAALIRLINRENRPDSFERAREEVADAIVCLEQMRLMLGRQEIDFLIETKLLRVSHYIGDDKPIKYED